MQISTPHPRRLPTEEEVKHCWSVIGRLDEEIIQDIRVNHLSFMSPIRCLPSELIGEICKTCVDMGVNPLVLSHVCGRFHETVNDMSELWSRIHVTDGRTDGWKRGLEYWLNPMVGLKCRGSRIANLIIQRAHSAPLEMIWDVPMNSDVLDVIERHTNRIFSLTLIVTRYHYREEEEEEEKEKEDAHAARLSCLSFRSLRHIFIPDGDRFRVPMYLQILSGLQLNKVTFEIEMSYNISQWFTDSSIWGHITTLIVYNSRSKIDGRSMGKPVMHSLKSLTIRDDPSLLGLLTFPKLLYLELSSRWMAPLSAQDLPFGLEVLKTKHIELQLDNLDTSDLFRTLLVFEGVESIISWTADGRFSLPRVRNLHMEELRTDKRCDLGSPLDVASVLSSHELPDSVNSLHLIGMAVMPTTIDAIQILRGLSELTIEGCYFKDDALSSLHHTLIPHYRESALPNLRFLRLSGFQPGCELEYDKLDMRQIISDASAPPSLQFEAGGFKEWPPSRSWDFFGDDWHWLKL
ncbi:hypothetical protein CPB86DRAFT_868884 [Serendipita vermifera]|nr:hypothetical protein CPB86DRAFT_868884 [Serendipita vermifera]